MINVHVYGHLKYKLAPGASLAENTVLSLPHVQHETFIDLLARLGITSDDIGDCFLNHRIITDQKTIITDGSRIGLFSSGMYLIDGGQYIKGHGFITKQPTVEIDYYEQPYGDT